MSLDLDAIRRRAQAASPAPWTIQACDTGGVTGFRIFDAAGEYVAGNFDYEVGGILNEADAEFAAAARTDVPALLADNERLRGLVRDLLDAWGSDTPPADVMARARALYARGGAA